VLPSDWHDKIVLRGPAIAPLSQAAGPMEKQTERKNMENVKQLLKNLMTEDAGQDLIEYALVAALIGLGSVAALTKLSNTLANTFGGVDNSLINSTA